MPNEQYQSLFGLAGAALREQFLDGAPAGVATFVADVPDDELAPLVTDLGGHDLAAMLDAYAQCDAVTDRPSVIFAYTVKGWGLPIAGNPRNHSALLTTEQIDALRAALGPDPRRPNGTGSTRPRPPASGAAARREALARPPRERSLPSPCPRPPGYARTSRCPPRRSFGRVLVDLARDEEVAPVPRDHRAGRRDLHQPRRLHQPDRRLRPRRAARLERGPGAAVGGGPRRASTSSSASRR